MIHVSADVSGFARDASSAREHASAEDGSRSWAIPGVTVVPPGDLVPAGGDHYESSRPTGGVAAPRRGGRAGVGSPAAAGPAGPGAGRSPTRRGAHGDAALAGPGPGGETAGRERLRGMTRAGLGGYDGSHDDLAADATSRLGPYLHFGCVSPLEVRTRPRDAPAAAFVRQLCWRDFYHQVLAARPGAARTRDYRPRGDRWARRRTRSRPGRPARPATRSSTPAMRQLAARASCTTGRA